jgi:hypothetical protein
MLEFSEAPIGALEKVSMRLNRMYWKKRELLVQTIIR